MIFHSVEGQKLLCLGCFQTLACVPLHPAVQMYPISYSLFWTGKHSKCLSYVSHSSKSIKPWGRGHGNLLFTAGGSAAQGQPGLGVGVWSGGQSCGTNHLTFGLWHYIHVDNTRLVHIKSERHTIGVHWELERCLVVWENTPELSCLMCSSFSHSPMTEFQVPPSYWAFFLNEHHSVHTACKRVYRRHSWSPIQYPILSLKFIPPWKNKESNFARVSTPFHMVMGLRKSELYPQLLTILTRSC